MGPHVFFFTMMRSEGFIDKHCDGIYLYMVYRKFLNEYAFSYIIGNEIPGNELFRKNMISLHVKRRVTCYLHT